MKNLVLSKVALKMGSPGITDWSQDIPTPENCVDLSIGQPDFAVSNNAIQGLYNSAKNGFNGYQDSQGIKPLRNAILKQFNLRKELDFDVSITCGATAGLYLSLMTCFNPGDEILITDPYFVQYIELAKIHNLNIKLINIYPDFILTFDKIKSSITSKTKGIIINSPNNPTGCVINKNEQKSIIEYLDKKNIYVIFDNIYRDYLYYDETTNEIPVVYSKNVVYINGFSKSHRVTGWRIGYVIAQKEIIHYLSELQAQLYQGVTSVAQYGILESLNEDLKPMINIYKKRLEYIKSNLDKNYIQSNTQGGFFVFIEVPKILNMSSLEYCKILKANGLIVVPGLVFSKQDTHFRISICKDILEIKKGVKILNNTFLQLKIETIKRYIENILNAKISLVGSHSIGIGLPNSDIDFAIGYENNNEMYRIEKILNENSFEFRGVRPSTNKTFRLLYSFYWKDQFVDIVVLCNDDYTHLVNGLSQANLTITKEEKEIIITTKKKLEQIDIEKYENYKLDIYKKYCPKLLWMNDIEICKYLKSKCDETKRKYPDWLRNKILEYCI